MRFSKLHCIKVSNWNTFSITSICFFFFTLIVGARRSLSLKLSDTRVYAPKIRARLRTTAHFCKVVAHILGWMDGLQSDSSNNSFRYESLMDWWGPTWREDALFWDRPRVVYHRVYFTIRRKNLKLFKCIGFSISSAKPLTTRPFQLHWSPPLFAGFRRVIVQIKGLKRRFDPLLRLSHRTYPPISLRKSTPPQNSQLIVYHHKWEYQVDGFVGELTF